MALGAVGSGSRCIPNGIHPGTNDSSVAVVAIAVFNQKVLPTPRPDSLSPLISAINSGANSTWQSGVPHIHHEPGKSGTF